MIASNLLLLVCFVISIHEILYEVFDQYLAVDERLYRTESRLRLTLTFNLVSKPFIGEIDNENVEFQCIRLLSTSKTDAVELTRRLVSNFDSILFKNAQSFFTKIENQLDNTLRYIPAQALGSKKNTRILTFLSQVRQIRANFLNLHETYIEESMEKIIRECIRDWLMDLKDLEKFCMIFQKSSKSVKTRLSHQIMVILKQILKKYESGFKEALKSHFDSQLRDFLFDKSIADVGMTHPMANLIYSVKIKDLRQQFETTSGMIALDEFLILHGTRVSINSLSSALSNQIHFQALKSLYGDSFN